MEHRAQHPDSERNDQSDLLGDRDELGGLVAAEVGIFPAQQRLEGDQGAVGRADPRLVVDLERHRLDCASEPVLEPPALIRLLLHGGVVQAEAVPTVLLRAMERGVAAAQHGLDRFPVTGPAGDADTGRDRHLVSLQHHGRRDRADQFRDDRGDLGFLGQPGQEQRELVSAEAGHRRAGVLADDPRQPIGDLANELVTRRVSERVVHELEAIQVEEEQREVLALQRRERECRGARS